MRVLGLDPGLFTGWAVVEESGCLDHGVIQFTTVAIFKTKLRRLIGHWNPNVIVRERMPVSISLDIAQVVSVCDVEAVRFERSLVPPPVSPGEWKPIGGKVKLPFSPSSQHEKDAFRMARYWLYKFEKVPLK